MRNTVFYLDTQSNEKEKVRIISQLDTIYIRCSVYPSQAYIIATHTNGLHESYKD